MRRLSYLFPALALLTSCLDLVAASLWSPDSDPPLWPLQSYKSSSIQTPFMNVTKSGQTEPGLLFLTPADTVRKHAPAAIYSDDGQLVWQGPDHKHFSALQSEILDGEPVLVYWAGIKLSGFGFGHISILNSSYDEIHRVTLDCKEHNIVTVADSKQQFDSCIDTHETRLTEHGTLVTTVANITNADLSSIGGPRDGWIQDSLVYEIDVKTNEVLFRWSTYEHRAELSLSYSMVPLQEEYYGTGESVKSAYEYSHVNSVVRYGDKYLVSARFMCSIFFIASNGTVIWHLHVNDSLHLPELHITRADPE